MRVDVAVHASDRVTALGAVSMLAADPHLRVLDEADRTRAEVVVVVAPTPGEEVFDWLRELGRSRAGTPPPRCVLVTDDFRAVGLVPAIECGIAAILPRRDTTGAELVRTVRAVSKGAASLPPAMQGALLDHLDRMRREVLEPNGLTMSGVTARERDVLRLLAEGHGLEEIATELGYAERTVKNVLYGLMTRLGLSTRAQAVAFALRTGVI
ncbi:helix-turn-helix transcriptional regulator [Actinophytocola xanthii]|uniref:Helix-turn-helix transcriptional regulator n=1 Tax=Actinophytocola xanthii TaxID=1912961 RepID=A0A1Q8CW64_9PSEU|nr:helix-turn-helix transcriptional regulator [Actinophytocola xanthii]